ncbi:MAG: hypothetical protein HY423_02510 [Candidatus Lambdaproteobacteria bacterium]|nr:hypothetical protein [Candidatus Lambdaproteobacteria bacterium]
MNRTLAARAAAPLLAVAALAAALLAGGCSTNFAEGQALEAQNRWEEAAIAYHLAVVDDPKDPEFQLALDRANKRVAREGFERYRTYLAAKQFRKAYIRLVDAARRDPDHEPVQAELRKWMRVLVGGEVRFEFQSLQTNLSLADEIRLVVRLNTPNPGETIDAEIDLATGAFHVEDLLYDRPDELLTGYSINAIGVRLFHGRNRNRQFTTREFIRFVNFRTPVMDGLSGKFSSRPDSPLSQVGRHRATIRDQAGLPRPAAPPANPHYSLQIEDHTIGVETAGGRSDFLPRFLYVNRQDRRVFVDFGRYSLSQEPESRRWDIGRLPIAGSGYFEELHRNVALQPYFFYRDGVFMFRPARAG